MMQLALGAGVLVLAVMTSGPGHGTEIHLAEQVDLAFDAADLETGGSQAGDPTGEGSNVASAPDRSVVLQCSPVGAYWTGTPKSEGMPPGPDLAIVSTKMRPKDARVHLDNRFVGRARYLDGSPGYLYLEPGRYLLEIHMGGYRSVLIELDAIAGCRYDLKHRMERLPGSVAEKKGDPPGKGEPFHRVFGPVPEDGSAPVGARGPDPDLRHDLEGEGAAGDAPPARGGSMWLQVSPEAARVSVDGEFVATGFELQRMESALAISAGRHHIVTTAPGYADDSRSVDIAEGETVEIVIELSKDRTIPSN